MRRFLLLLFVIAMLAPPKAEAILTGWELTFGNNESIYTWVTLGTGAGIKPPYIGPDQYKDVFAASNRTFTGFFEECLYSNCIRSIVVTDSTCGIDPGPCSSLGGISETLSEKDLGIGKFNNGGAGLFGFELSQNYPKQTLKVYAVYTYTENPHLETFAVESFFMPETLAGCSHERLGLTSDVSPSDRPDVIRYAAEMIVPTTQTAVDLLYAGYNRWYLRAGVDENDAEDGPPYYEAGLDMSGFVSGPYWHVNADGKTARGALDDIVWGTDTSLDYRVNNCAGSFAGIHCADEGATEGFEWEMCVTNPSEDPFHDCFVATEEWLDLVGISHSAVGPGSEAAVTAAHSTCGEELFLQVSSVTSRMHFTPPVYRTAIPNTPTESNQDPSFIGGGTDGTVRCCSPGIWGQCVHTTATVGVIKDQVGIQYELESGTTLPTTCLDF